MSYKDTLLMPKTDFNMKGNLPENEKLMREKWEEMNLYQEILKKNENNETFILHDGPPYANVKIHIGTAFNKILKDFVNRYKMLCGYKTIYIPGWDTHGLPIETAVINMGIDRKKVAKIEFRNYCEKYAREQIKIQKEQFKNLNVIGDWDNPYVTFDKNYEARQIEVFAEMVKRGLIYKGLKPVYWSPSSESALAEAEIEYKDKTDYSIYITFKIEEGNDYVKKGDNLIIWTTTPWTLPGNLAIAVGSDYDYSKVEIDNKNYIIATELKDILKVKFGFNKIKEVATFKGYHIENIKYKHCFEDKKLPVVISDHVNLDSGTGLVHIAPGYGVEDFEVGQKYNLGIIIGIDEQGYLTDESVGFGGLFYEEANEVIINKLTKNGDLLKKEMITHSYPHDWRTKKPVIFKATNQWFCSIESIKEDILKEITEKIKWDPSWGKQRLYSMIKERKDWCISRQRVWGVPLPIFYNEDGSAILEQNIIMYVAELFRKYGSNVWFEKEAKDLLPPGYTNPKSPNGHFTKENDIMDVWFDSGSSHTGVLKERNLKYPADMYLEGTDQYRGWFNSSLICGVAVYNETPYKSVLSHGFVLDGDGFKMSKSLGNVIDPNEIVNKYGSDILRLWVASVDFRDDVRISDEMLKQITETYRKIRNTYRFILGNLTDFNPVKDSVSYDDLYLYDKYILIELNELILKVRMAYEAHNYQEIIKYINNFIISKLSTFYLDFSKDILYIEKVDSHKRRCIQTVIYETLRKISILMSVITPYTSEEVYSYIPGNKERSIHLEKIPEVINYKDKITILNKFKLFFEIKEDVYKALEEARINKIVNKSQEAKVYLNVKGEHQKVINELKDYLSQLLIVSKVELSDMDLVKYDNCQIKVEKFMGVKCNRCWVYFEEKEMNDDICLRCYNIIN